MSGGGPSHSLGGNGGTTNAGTPDTFTIAINAGTGAVNFSDTLGLANGAGTTLTTAQLSGINAIIIGNSGTGGAIQAVTLTGPSVPEPAALALVAIGMLGTLLLPRKQRGSQLPR